MRYLVVLLFAVLIVLSCDRGSVPTSPTVPTATADTLNCRRLLVEWPGGARVQITGWGIRLFTSDDSESVKPVVDILNGPAGEVTVRNLDDDVVTLDWRGLSVFSPGAVLVDRKQVLGPRQPAIEDATSPEDVVARFNEALAAMRAHGLIESE